MDEETAVKILTLKLAQNSGISIVRDDWHKKELIKNSRYYCQFSNPLVISHSTFEYYSKKEVDYFRKWRFLDSRDEINRDNSTATIEDILKKDKECAGANYFFVDNPIQDKSQKELKGFHFFITPYSIIGNKEIIKIRETFYKDTPAKVSCAMDVLKIKNYACMYEQYLNLAPDKRHLLSSHLCRFMNLVPYLKFDSGDDDTTIDRFDIAGGVDKINYGFRENGINQWINPNETFAKRKIINNIVDDIKNHYDCDFSQIISPKLFDDFINFVFTIPYEHQNTEINKQILRANGSNIDYLMILEKEYMGGRYFYEYFDCLDDELQQKVVKSLKNVPERNLANDSFLWSRGFKEVTLDYMDIYKKDADKFIEYFGSRAPEDKRIILKDIMKCDYTNQSVADWLDENELDLMREVSMDG